MRLVKLRAIKSLRQTIQIKPLIAVCIPAYRSAAFIGDTLRSLQSQTFSNFHATISIDGNDLDTLKACEPFVIDPRFKVIVQEQRLGWVQNTNWLLTQAEGDYISILPHDDLLHPYYLEELLKHLHYHPECSLAYTDTEGFSHDRAFHHLYFAQASLKGSLFSRMHRYLTHNFDAVGFRGLMPKKTIDATTLLQNNSFNDFAADTLWLGEIAKKGELHRLPYPLCRKRYHTDNTHLKWFKQTKTDQRLAWKQHCLELLDTFTQEITDLVEKQQLATAADQRFTKGCSRFNFPL